MFKLQHAPINWLHVMLALIVVAAIAVGSVLVLPERFIDYGLMSGIGFWAAFVVISQWARPPLQRTINVILALFFVSMVGFIMWPFDYPM